MRKWALFTFRVDRQSTQRNMFCFGYLDDILIFSANMECLTHLQCILNAYVQPISNLSKRKKSITLSGASDLKRRCSYFIWQNTQCKKPTSIQNSERDQTDNGIIWLLQKIYSYILISDDTSDPAFPKGSAFHLDRYIQKDLWSAETNTVRYPYCTLFPRFPLFLENLEMRTNFPAREIPRNFKIQPNIRKNFGTKNVLFKYFGFNGKDDPPNWVLPRVAKGRESSVKGRRPPTLPAGGV